MEEKYTYVPIVSHAELEASLSVKEDYFIIINSNSRFEKHLDVACIADSSLGNSYEVNAKDIYAVVGYLFINGFNSKSLTYLLKEDIVKCTDLSFSQCEYILGQLYESAFLNRSFTNPIFDNIEVNENANLNEKDVFCITGVLANGEKKDWYKKIEDNGMQYTDKYSASKVTALVVSDQSFKAWQNGIVSAKISKAVKDNKKIISESRLANFLSQ